MIVEKFPTVGTLYSIWLVLLYLIVAYAILSGEMLYRMEQVVDYLGNVPPDYTREKAAVLLMAMVLLAELLPLWFGAFIIQLNTRDRLWTSWPISCFSIIIAYTIVQNTNQLSDLYSNLVGPLDLAFAFATIVLMLMIVIVVHATDYHKTHSIEVSRSDLGK